MSPAIMTATYEILSIEHFDGFLVRRVVTAEENAACLQQVKQAIKRLEHRIGKCHRCLLQTHNPRNDELFYNWTGTYETPFSVGPPPTGDYSHPTLLGRSYPCATERSNESELCLYRNNNHTIPRWEYNGVLRWFLRPHGLTNKPWEFARLEHAMITATNNWNSENIGVQFKQVFTEQEALFTVMYKQNLTGAYAVAFPPGDPRPVIDVGPGSFDKHSVKYLSEILTHELGHVLGFRHHYWKHFNEPEAVSMIVDDPLNQPFQWFSVMNPYLGLSGGLQDLQISERDRDWAKYFYHNDGPIHGKYPLEIYSTEVP